MRSCKHPSCGDQCSKPQKVTKVYKFKRTEIKKKKPAKLKNRTPGFTGPLPLPEVLQLAQMIFNKWIRERDKEKPCISSGGWPEQAGHFYPAGSYSGVRFDEINVNGQSKEDNCFKAGNEQEYRVGLIVRYGPDLVAQLDERANETKFYKWTRDELQNIIHKYKLIK